MASMPVISFVSDSVYSVTGLYEVLISAEHMKTRHPILLEVMIIWTEIFPRTGARVCVFFKYLLAQRNSFHKPNDLSACSKIISETLLRHC